jgi:hypothetical protein
VPLVAGFEDEIPLLRVHDLIAEQRSHASLKDIAVLVLVRVTVERGGECPWRDRMLDEREPTTGFLAPNHESNADGAEVDGFPIVGPEDARALRGLKAIRVGSCRIV